MKLPRLIENSSSPTARSLPAGIVAIEDSRSRREEALSRRVSLEKMLKELSTKAIAIEDAGAFIEHSLSLLGRRVGVGGSFLWEYNPARKSLSNTYEWLAEGIAPKMPLLQNIPVDSLPRTVGRLMQGDILRVEDVGALPPGGGRELLEKIGVRACLIIPLFSREAFYGFVGFECHNGPKPWAAEDVQILQAAAEIMMSCIENREAARQMISGRQNLEKRVEKKTLALRHANRRLSAEIAAHRKSILELKRREAELADRNRTFVDLSNALAALLNMPVADPGDAEECLISKLNRLIDPAETDPAAAGLDEARQKTPGSFQKSLQELSSFLKTKSNFVYQCLTPMEARVARLIVQNKCNKEIASLLNLSRRTIEVHRFRIRRKLQLKNARTNLKTYLNSME